MVEMKARDVIFPLTFDSEVSQFMMEFVAKTKFARLPIALMIGILWLVIGAKAQAEKTPHRVLILHGTNTILPANVIVERMVRETVSAAAPT